MHVTDTLERGGAEQVAVSLSNLLPRDRFAVFHCTTRREGPLAANLGADVGRLRLERRGRFDLAAIRRLAAFNQAHGIQILHAHGTALFIARAASCFAPYPRVVWHDHYGNAQVSPRPVWLYRPGHARHRGRDCGDRVAGGVGPLRTPGSVGSGVGAAKFRARRSRESRCA